MQFALVAQLDRAVVSGATSCGGSSPPERVTPKNKQYLRMGRSLSSAFLLQ